MNKEAARIFSKVILSDKQVRIKLLGDSITQGVGGSGFEDNGEHIVENHFRNPNGYCWANLFIEHMESMYNCKVINNGCSGAKIEFILESFDELVESTDDIVICTIGTNNRHQYFKDAPKYDKNEYMKKFYMNIIELDNKFKAIKKDVIFIANIPALAKSEKDGEDLWRIFNMNDVQDLYTKASFENDFPLINLYTLFLEYCELRNIPLKFLMADGLHPNDAGHNVMFNLITNELGVAKKVDFFAKEEYKCHF